MTQENVKSLEDFKALLIRVDVRTEYMTKTIEDQRGDQKLFREEIHKEIKDIRHDISVLQKFNQRLTTYVIALGTSFGLIFKYAPTFLVAIFK